MERKVAFKTLGCKLNQAETEAVATGFRQLGWNIVDFGSGADAVVVNGCTVTNTADRKSRSAMNQALRALKNPVEGLVVMTGCFVDGNREQLEADGRTYLVGNSHKSLIPQLVDAHFRGELLPGHIESRRDPFGFPLAEPIFRTRAMVKIQDGCDNFCAFCIIPFVRGRAVSRTLEDTVGAVAEAVTRGYREIVLTGVNMSRWSEGSGNFSDLVASVLDVNGDFRLRLGSVEPDRLDNRLVDLMSHPKMTPHIHLCLQSGSEKILRSMRRQYTAAGFEDLAGEFRKKVPHFNITTDVIVGYPGESESDFQDTLDVCRRIGFGHIHTFPYSRRDKTGADRMDNHLDEGEKKNRTETVRRLGIESKRLYRLSLTGTIQEVLAETAASGSGTLKARGLSAPYVPVSFPVPDDRRAVEVRNRIWRVRIDRAEPGDDPDLEGTLIPD